ncbi:hypothetical protein JOF48_001079 [Arthrobacter stackebrandtii]|uniref:DUF222 domain-containing protein n=1 Tax=Arthrobacter stackebrandtii TaxID=272161 RepID=A0ABS4YUY0_9MICC|nr:hypothetical protein [Arthrobacter stackebrandtii]MBP2412280.1 hypothetical protein [Arthrobacter stackebrandtii]PYH02063.1 hypothetical protein CVV67_01055 [Arthrobacter stackebrandtii]
MFEALGPLCVPETVHSEMTRKARTDERFSRTQSVLGKLPRALLEILNDDAAGPLSESFERIAKMPMSGRIKNGKDLGEMMVVAHAATQAERGYDVTVLIDDRGGQLLASHESRRLGRLRTAEPQTGQLQMITSVTVLERSIAGRHLPDHAALRKLCVQMMSLDDGLLPLEMTGLLDSPRWAANR